MFTRNWLSRRSLLKLAGAAAASSFLPSGGRRIRPEKIRVMIATGQNNHDWKRTSPLMKQILEQTGKFAVELSTSPPGNAPAQDWENWNPTFKDYDLVLSDYNGQMWPERVRDAFVTYIDRGGRALIQHAANNSFTGWTEYEQMVGQLWRDNKFGPRLYLDDDGQVVKVPAGEGPGAGHGGLHDWPISCRDEANPIFAGLPTTWMHAHDELYHGQRGPAENMHILASAYSSKESGGTGVHELMLWWVPYGSGRVLTFLPGHLWGGQQDSRSFRCVGFRTLLQRAAEWTATDEVTIAIPDNFPTADQTSIVDA